MEELDLLIRRLTYARFVELGRAPAPDELGLPGQEVESAWRRLHDMHALVLKAGTTELRMANPFSAVPTAYRVQANDRWWFANCAWDAFGICAALGVDGHIETACPDCSDAIEVDVSGRRPDPDEHLFHCLVSAARWWDDIAFT